jgi:DNA-binding Xre family transcriptional regulator
MTKIITLINLSFSVFAYSIQFSASLIVAKYREFSIVQKICYTSLCFVAKTSKKEYYVNKAALSLIGTRMREVRLKKDITIEYLANTSGMDYSQLARMELGQVNFSISYLFRVAEALGVTPKDLLP